MISRLDRYVARTWLSSLAVALVFFVGLSSVFDFFGGIDDLLEHEDGQATAGLLLRFYALSLPDTLLQVEPFVVLVAALFTVNRLQRHNEFLAMLLTGRSSLRVALPILLLSALLVGALVWVQEVLAPKMAVERLAQESRLYHDDELVLKDVALRDAAGRELRARDVRVEDGVIAHFYMSWRDERGRSLSVDGQEAVYDPVAGGWRLQQGRMEIRDGDRPPQVEEVAFAPTDIRPEDLLVEDLPPFAHDYGEVLAKCERYPASTRWRLLKHYHVTFPLSVLLLVGLGLPFVLKVRVRSAWLGLGISVLICAGFLILEATLRDLGGRGLLSPILAAWLPAILAGSLAVVLLDTADG